MTTTWWRYNKKVLTKNKKSCCFDYPEVCHSTSTWLIRPTKDVNLHMIYACTCIDESIGKFPWEDDLRMRKKECISQIRWMESILTNSKVRPLSSYDLPTRGQQLLTLTHDFQDFLFVTAPLRKDSPCHIAPFYWSKHFIKLSVKYPIASQTPRHGHFLHKIQSYEVFYMNSFIHFAIHYSNDNIFR